MSRRRSVQVAVAVGVALAAALVSGCGDDVTVATSGEPTGASSVESSATPSPSAPVSLPPGDPGLEAPEVPEPGLDEPEPSEEEAPARVDVPADAMLDAETVGMMLGGSWQAHPGDGDECLRPEGALGQRSMSFGGSVDGLVVQTVATYPNDKAADAAVTALGDTAAGCGWIAQPDPRLGTASVAADDGPRTMTAVSAEGVVVVLVGTGEFTADPMRWGSLVDLAVGSSCPAGPHGCD